MVKESDENNAKSDCRAQGSGGRGALGPSALALEREAWLFDLPGPCALGPPGAMGAPASQLDASAHIKCWNSPARRRCWVRPWGVSGSGSLGGPEGRWLPPGHAADSPFGLAPSQPARPCLFLSPSLPPPCWRSPSCRLSQSWGGCPGGPRRRRPRWSVRACPATGPTVLPHPPAL